MVFCNSDLKWLKCLQDGFQHCFIMRRDFDSVWTVIQCNQLALEVQSYLIEDFATPYDFVAGATVIECEKSPKLSRGLFCHLNCVEVVKAVLGINKPFIFTPYQLYRWIYEERTITGSAGEEEACIKPPETADCSTKAGPAAPTIRNTG